MDVTSTVSLNRTLRLWLVGRTWDWLSRVVIPCRGLSWSNMWNHGWWYRYMSFKGTWNVSLRLRGTDCDVLVSRIESTTFLGEVEPGSWQFPVNDDDDFPTSEGWCSWMNPSRFKSFVRVSAWVPDRQGRETMTDDKNSNCWLGVYLREIKVGCPTDFCEESERGLASDRYSVYICRLKIPMTPAFRLRNFGLGFWSHVSSSMNNQYLC